MKNFAVVAVVLALCGAVYGEGLPSSKATADVSTLVKCTMTMAGEEVKIPESCVDLYSGTPVATENAWIPIMEKQVKLSNSQSLFVSPSLVAGLYTRTRTKTQTGSTSTAQAMGGVYLRAVLVPAAGGAPIAAAPLSKCSSAILGCVDPTENPDAPEWGVMLDTRIQTLSQELSACVIDVTSIPDTTNDGSCTFTSTIDLVLQTTSAHTFNFIFPNVGQGTYTLKVMAAVASGAQIINGSGTAVGASAFGIGSVLVESVRLVHNFDF